jgi:hypothetical protein
MTEEQLRSGTWDSMGHYFLARQRSKRKKMLAFCARCRCTWEHTRLECNRNAIEASERYADGQLELDELRRAWQQTRFEPVVFTTWPLAAAGPVSKSRFPQVHPQNDRDKEALAAFRPVQTRFKDEWDAASIACGLDVFGNVFKKAKPAPAWGTDTVRALAKQMYDSREFGAMPILADALQDAGCNNDDILDHCRDPHARHVRGCWVVDLVLGKG